MNTLLGSAGSEQVRIDSIHLAVISLAARAIATLKTWAHRVRSRGQLAEFDEAMLRDIGISRANADFEASKPFWQP